MASLSDITDHSDLFLVQMQYTNQWLGLLQLVLTSNIINAYHLPGFQDNRSRWLNQRSHSQAGKSLLTLSFEYAADCLTCYSYQHMLSVCLHQPHSPFLWQVRAYTMSQPVCLVPGLQWQVKHTWYLSSYCFLCLLPACLLPFIV